MTSTRKPENKNSIIGGNNSIMGDNNSIIGGNNFTINGNNSIVNGHNSIIRGKKFVVNFGSKKGHQWAEYNPNESSIYINGKNGPTIHFISK